MNNLEEKEVRKKYFEAIGNERKIERLLKKLRDIENPSSLLLAYRAACESMMAQFSWNPYIKLAQVTKSFDFFSKSDRKRQSHITHANNPNFRIFY